MPISDHLLNWNVTVERRNQTEAKFDPLYTDLPAFVGKPKAVPVLGRGGLTATRLVAVMFCDYLFQLVALDIRQEDKVTVDSAVYIVKWVANPGNFNDHWEIGLERMVEGAY